MKTGTKYRVEADSGKYGTHVYFDGYDIKVARDVASYLRSRKSCGVAVGGVRVVTVKTVRRVIRRGGAYAELYPIVDEITGEDVWGWCCNASPYAYTGSATTFDEARETARRMLRVLLKTTRKTE